MTLLKARGRRKADKDRPGVNWSSIEIALLFDQLRLRARAQRGARNVKDDQGSMQTETVQGRNIHEKSGSTCRKIRKRSLNRTRRSEESPVKGG